MNKSVLERQRQVERQEGARALPATKSCKAPMDKIATKLHILCLIVLFFFLSTFKIFTQEVKLTTEVPKEFVSLIEEGKTWWQILPGYEIFLSIFGCLYFAFAVQVLLNFLKEERK